MGTINDFKLNDGSYKVHKKASLGTVKTTYYAIQMLKVLSSTYIELIKSAEGLIQHENIEGGFSPIDGLKPRLSSTYQALSILSDFKLIKYINKDATSEWIRTLQRAEGYFHDSISKFTDEEQTFYALSSLCILGGIDEIDKRQCINWLHIKWKADKRDFCSIYHLLKCLELIGELNENTKNEANDLYVIPSIEEIQNLRIEENLSGLYYFYKIAEIAMDNNVLEIKKLVPDLEKRICISFLSYLGRS